MSLSEKSYSGLTVTRLADGSWRIDIPNGDGSEFAKTGGTLRGALRTAARYIECVFDDLNERNPPWTS